MSNFSFLETEQGMLEITQHNPARFASLTPITENILRGPSELSIAQRELIFAFVSARNACSFCFNAHQSIAQEFGVSPDVLNDLAQQDANAEDAYESVEAKLRPCIALANKVVTDASKIVRKDITDVMDTGWHEDTAHDVISIVALATFCNYLVSAHGVVGSQGYFKQVASAFGPDGGYAQAASE